LHHRNGGLTAYNPDNPYRVRAFSISTKLLVRKKNTMNSLNKDITVTMISVSIGKTPKDVTQSFVFDEACRLACRGIGVHIVRSKFERGDEVSYGICFHGIERRIDVRALHLLIRNFPIYPPISLLRKPYLPYWENLYALSVVKVAKKSNANLIHAHFAYPEGLVGLLAKRETKKPLIISVWGRDVQSDPRSGYGALSTRKSAYLVRQALSSADAIITSAESHYRTVIRLIGEDEKDKVYPISPGIDVVRFNPNVNGDVVRSNLDIKDNQHVVLFPKRLHPIYGVELLIKAASYVIKKCPNTIFLILGEGPLLPRLQRLVGKLGITNNVKFLGLVSRDKMPFYYAASDLVVDPTIFGQGYAALEAMACGKPVIGFKVGQIKIRDNLDGFLVEPYDVKTLADKIIQLIIDPELRKRMGENARMNVVKNYNIDIRIDNIIHIYDTLLRS